MLIALKQLDPTKEYRVYFSDKKKNRSNKQNAYYWGVVLHVISKHTGSDSEELHELFKCKFGLKTRFNLKSEFTDNLTVRHKNELETELIEEFPISTSVLNTAEFTDYLDKIVRWSGEKLGLYIPKPNDLSDEDFINYIER